MLTTCVPKSQPEAGHRALCKQGSSLPCSRQLYDPTSGCEIPWEHANGDNFSASSLADGQSLQPLQDYSGQGKTRRDMCPMHYQFCFLVALNCPPLLFFHLPLMHKIKQTALFCSPDRQQSRGTTGRGVLGKTVTAWGGGMLSGSQPPPA